MIHPLHLRSELGESLSISPSSAKSNNTITPVEETKILSRRQLRQFVQSPSAIIFDLGG
ncbi:hypothetical protein A2U01_0118972, partial [Trifolium medium]|nr:hypothetical protein [Trifolium medium]